jgi:hypothetical protein
MHGIYVTTEVTYLPTHNKTISKASHRQRKKNTAIGRRRKKGGKHAMGNQYKYNSKRFEKEQTTLKHHFMPVE